MNPKLKDSVTIFKELGWEHATPANILTLPTGTPAQKKLALEGLKSGELGVWERNWKTHYNVNIERLVLFAIRVGVTPQRTSSLLQRHWPTKLRDALVPVIKERGAKFAASYIEHRFKSMPWFDDTAIKLVEEMDLDIPQSANYIQNWLSFALNALKITRDYWLTKEVNWDMTDAVKRRFAEHIHMGFEVNVPPAGNFSRLVIEGINKSMLQRDEIIPLIFASLDAAIRPFDRKTYLEMLDELNITDQELTERIQALIPILAAGDNNIVNRLAPSLIANASDDLLAEVVISSLSATTKKARLLVLKTAIKRDCPSDIYCERATSSDIKSEVACSQQPPAARKANFLPVHSIEELTPWLLILSNDKDKAISTAAEKLMKAWDIQTDTDEDEEFTIQELWQDTPPVWQVPAFETGEVSQDALTERIAEIYDRAEGDYIHDVIVERALAVTTELAYKSTEDVKLALSGLRSGQWWGSTPIALLHYWINGRINHAKFNTINEAIPLEKRDINIVSNLGKIPCMLSTPSKEDLSITVPDLAARISLYDKQSANALKDDLFIALTRLDVSTKTPEAIEILKSTKVPIKKSNDKFMRTILKPVYAGNLVQDYIDDPFTEAHIKENKGGRSKRIDMPNSLDAFKSISNMYGTQRKLLSIFPLFGDVALGGICWEQGYHTHTKGHILRQAAKRANPLPPGGAVNFFGAQRSLSLREQEDATLATLEAWERGLLRPGVADVSLLDWAKEPPSNLALLAAVLDGFSRDGLLSVVWPILDALVETSLQAPRLLAGTAELAQLIAELLPEVQFAIENGKTGESALNLPGIRELAQRGGSSKAVTAAKNIVAKLPHIESTPKKVTAPKEEIPFDQVWQQCKSSDSIIEDGVAVKIEIPKDLKFLLFSLTLPGVEDCVLYVLKDGWVYDLEMEGCCQAFPEAPTTRYARDRWDTQVFLHWDGESIIVKNNRDFEYGSKKAVPKLSQSMLTIVIALLAQDGDAVYFAPRLLDKFIKDGQVNQYVVRHAVQTILQNPAVNPAKLTRTMEKDIKYLLIMWPVITESIKLAGEKVTAGEKPPVWVNRVLDVALRYAPYLTEAMKRGLIPAENANWTGLAEIASSKAKSTAVAKAKELITRKEELNDPKKPKAIQ